MYTENCTADEKLKPYITILHSVCTNVCVNTESVLRGYCSWPCSRCVSALRSGEPAHQTTDPAPPSPWPQSPEGHSPIEHRPRNYCSAVRDKLYHHNHPKSADIITLKESDSSFCVITVKREKKKRLSVKI